MFLTQENYRKIESWLKVNSKKDTDFDFADSIDGSETIAIVQDNKNKRISIDTLLGNFINKDFINITNTLHLHGINLETAIHSISIPNRKEGLIITFEGTDSNWYIYQFVGNLSQWYFTDQWKDILNWETYVVESVLPDNEDLTTTEPDEQGNTRIKFADKEYNSDNFSGLGHIILRKNLVEVKDPQTGKSRGIVNFLYQDMINKENTVYEIRYDFDLNGQTITIPNNCTLKFKGGSIYNGTIIGSNSKITTDTFKIFQNIIIEGTWCNEYVTLDWFDFDHTQDCFNYLKSIITLSNKAGHKKIVVPEDNYIIVLNSDKGIELESNTELSLNGIINIVPNSLLSYKVFEIKNKENVQIIGGAIIGDVETHTGDTGEWGHGIYILGSKNVKISNIEISKCWGDGICVADSGDMSTPLEKNTMSSFVYIDNVVCNYNRRLGMSVTGGYDVYITNSQFNKNGTIRGTLPKAGIDIEANKNSDTDRIFINNCYLNNQLIISRYIGGGIPETPKVYKISNCKATSLAPASNGIDIYNCECKYIWADHCKNVTLDNCKITQFVMLSEECYDVLFKNCYISSDSRLHGYPGLINTGENGSFSGEFINTTFNLDNDEGVIRLSSSNSSNTSIDLVNCTIQASKRYCTWSLGNVYNSNIDCNRIWLSDSLHRTEYIYQNNTIKAADHCIILGSDVEAKIKFINNNFITGTGTGALILKYQYNSDIEFINNSYNNGARLLNEATGDEIGTMAQGSIRFDPDLKQLTFYAGSSNGGWKDVLGRALSPKYSFGTSEQKPYDDITFPGYMYHNTTTKNTVFRNADNTAWIDAFGFKDARHEGITSWRPVDPTEGHMYYDRTVNKAMWWEEGMWRDPYGVAVDVKRYGTFANKPSSADNIPIGFSYFCTDKSTQEGTSTGIMIYYKSNNTWVDALGRTIS